MQPSATEIILRAVCSTWGVSRKALLSPDRSRKLSRPRQAAYLLLRDIGGRTLPEIGQRMKRNHATVWHGIEAARNLDLSCREFGTLLAKAAKTAIAQIEGEPAARAPTGHVEEMPIVLLEG